MRRGFVVLPNWLVDGELPDGRPVSPLGRSLCTLVLRRAGRDSALYANQGTIAKCLGCSPRAVGYATQEVEELGLVAVERPRGKRPNVITPLAPLLMVGEWEFGGVTHAAENPRVSGNVTPQTTYKEDNYSDKGVNEGAVVAREGRVCEAPGCGKSLDDRRASTKTCDGKCRQAACRARNAQGPAEASRDAKGAQGERTAADRRPRVKLAPAARRDVAEAEAVRAKRDAEAARKGAPTRPSRSYECVLIGSPADRARKRERRATGAGGRDAVPETGSTSTNGAGPDGGPAREAAGIEQRNGEPPSNSIGTAAGDWLPTLPLADEKREAALSVNGAGERPLLVQIEHQLQEEGARR